MILAGCGSLNRPTSTLGHEGKPNPSSRVAFVATRLPFGAFDEAIVKAVQQRWYSLLAEWQKRPVRGEVSIEFHLHSDGRISDINILKNEVGWLMAQICKRAIIDSAPFRPWTDEMRRMVGVDYRDVDFTFRFE